MDAIYNLLNLNMFTNNSNSTSNTDTKIKNVIQSSPTLSTALSVPVKSKALSDTNISATINTVGNIPPWSEVEELLTQDNPKTFIAACEKNPRLLLAKDHDDNRLVHFASEKGLTDLVAWILNKDATQTNVFNKQKLTPGMCAADAGNFDCLDLCLEHQSAQLPIAKHVIRSDKIEVLKHISHKHPGLKYKTDEHGYRLSDYAIALNKNDAFNVMLSSDHTLYLAECGSKIIPIRIAAKENNLDIFEKIIAYEPSEIDNLPKALLEKVKNIAGVAAYLAQKN